MSDNFEVEAGKELSFAEKLGMHPGLAIGYLGLLLFMVGDGVEAGFLSPLLVDLHFSTEKVALVFSAYGAPAALASWLSGALTDIFGPKKVMWAGLLIWLGLEMPFLLGGIAHANYTTILVCYGVRGLGYPLFAYGFLCWVAAVTPQRYLATAIGWFWSARTGGLPTLGALLASFSVPLIGGYKTLWVSVGLVAAGGLIALLGVREEHGNLPLSATGDDPLKVLFTGVSIIWKHPKVRCLTSFAARKDYSCQRARPGHRATAWRGRSARNPDHRLWKSHARRRRHRLSCRARVGAAFLERSGRGSDRRPAAHPGDGGRHIAAGLRAVSGCLLRGVARNHYADHRFARTWPWQLDSPPQSVLAAHRCRTARTD